MTSEVRLRCIDDEKDTSDQNSTMADVILEVGDINGNTEPLSCVDKGTPAEMPESIKNPVITPDVSLPVSVPVPSEEPKVVEAATTPKQNGVAASEPHPTETEQSTDTFTIADIWKAPDTQTQINKPTKKLGRPFLKRRVRFARSPSRKVVRKEDANGTDVSKDVVLTGETVSSIGITAADDDDAVIVPATNRSTSTEGLSDAMSALVKHESDSGMRGNHGPVSLATPREKRPSHYRILQRCVDRALLHSVLKVGPTQYQCPICNCYKNHVGYMLLHVRVHKNLEPVLDLYRKAGGTLKEIPAEDADNLPKKVKGFVPTAVELVGKRLRRRSTKHDLGIFYENNLVHKFTRKRRSADSVVVDQDESKEKSDEPRDAGSLDSSPNKKTRSPRNVKTEFDSRDESDNDVSAADPDDSVSESALASSAAPRSKGIKVKIRKKKLGKAAKQCIGNVGLRARRQMLYKMKKKQVAAVGAKQRSFLSREISRLVKQDLVGKVSFENPHTCRFCGKVFYHGKGLHFHYVKHAKSLAIPNSKNSFEQKPNGQLGKPFDRAEFAFDELVCALKREEHENEAGLLKELGNDVNVLIEQLVGDPKVLECLGWPDRNTGDLVTDILERCNLQPSRERLNIISPLQCLRKNVFELLTFCIDDSAMESYGWNRKSIDEVVKEIIKGGI